MKLYYQPEGFWFGDCMPYGKDDRFYLFHQRDTRKPCPFGEPFGWDLAATKDFIHYEDLGTAIPTGSNEAQDQFIFAGSICEDRNGLYHAFYTGFNRDYPAQGKASQVLMHATSDDLVYWNKTNDTVTFTPQPGYDPDDWRDPFVLWDEEEEQYILILGARLEGDKHLTTGRTVYFTSKDLNNWEFQGDFWAPDLFTMHEMPDLFRMGDWWYLITTEYSHASTQVYRMAKSLRGPWLTPDDDQFDGRTYYAGRTYELNGQRIIFGWVPTRANETDSAHPTYDADSDKQDFIWGGTYVAHELYQRPDGTLGCKIPDTIREQAFGTPLKLEDITLQRPDGRSLQMILAHTASDCFLFEADVCFGEGTREFSIGLRAAEATGESYNFSFLCKQNCFVFEKFPNWPWPQMNNMGLERPIQLMPSKNYHVQIVVDDSIATIYVDGIALNTRMYLQPGDGICVGAINGNVSFQNITIAYR